ncbi:MAG: putative basic amino acid antiporter YfcC [Marinisporobacter sp.]|nr:putative basic amino acid antiporter YfcC [Marinisporobacter sp.]
MTSEAKTKMRNKWQMPDTYVIIFFIVVLAAVLTYIVPTGRFEIFYDVLGQDGEAIVRVADNAKETVQIDGNDYTIDATGDKTYVFKGEEEVGAIKKSKAKSFEYSEGGVYKFKVVQIYGNYITEGNKTRIKLFEKGGGLGFLNYVYEGFCSGDKWGSAVGVMAFILVVGGAFGIVLKTGAIETGIMHIISKTKGYEIAIIPILFFLFSLGGAVFGMGEETIPFVMILAPVMVALGYDSIVAVMVSYIATQIGFATSWMNPFSVAIAQGVAGIQVGSGNMFRIVMWITFTILGAAYTMIYATKIKKNPQSSLAYETDAFFRKDLEKDKDHQTDFGIGHALVVITLALGMAWIIWGVNVHEYYLPEIATVFFTIGLVSGIIGILFKLNNMRVNDIASSFRKGAEDLVGAAMVVGMAKGIILVLGGTGAGNETVLNTILSGMANALSGISPTIAACVMYIFQSVVNFFVVSGSGQAALTMPLMAPLAQLIGVTKQVAVLAFQLGDGFTNCVVPTAATLMGVLAIARLEWVKWLKFQIKMQLMLFIGSIGFIVTAVLIGYN